MFRCHERTLHCRGLLAGTALALLAQTAAAHEYWIAPSRYRVEAGEPIEARLLVGQMMEGTELPWLSHQIRSFEVLTPQGAVEVQGMEGDLPALSYVPEAPGLHVIAHETFPLEVTFDTLEEFREYLDYEGLGAMIAEHQRRALPETAIIEAYVRSAKALVQVGPVGPDDSDRPVGLAFELVALSNPYAGGDVLPVRLSWQGEPVAGAPISIFRKSDDVERHLVRTGADGRAEISIAGGGEFLLNAVHLEPVDGAEHVWESTWSSLTFGLARRN